MQELFSGVRILDLTKVFSGPFCSRMFADYGAEVIKIEHPAAPDDSREFPPQKNGWSGYYELLNRGKKGITLDLKTDEGIGHFFRLAKTADVIVENLTPQTKFKLGIDYERVKNINPKIIYASISGTGQDQNRRYYDILAQAESGLMTVSGVEGEPMKIGPSVVDAFTGMTLAFGISGALLHREKTGEGQIVDVSMLGAAMHLLESNLTEASIIGKNPAPSGNQDSMIAPFGIYKAQGGFVVIAAGNDRQWNILSDYLAGNVDFDTSLFKSNILRVKHNSTLTEIIERALEHISVDQAILDLGKLGIPVSRVNTMIDVLRISELFSSGELIQLDHPNLGSYVEPGFPLRFSDTKKPSHHKAPQLGEHNSDYGI